MDIKGAGPGDASVREAEYAEKMAGNGKEQATFARELARSSLPTGGSQPGRMVARGSLHSSVG